MRHKLLLFEILGFIVTAALGVLFHFLFDWSNENGFVALFTAVNESTWEHLKLIFFPYFFYTILEYILAGKCYQNFLYYKSVSVLIGIASIVILFYSYTGVLGTNYGIMDVLIYMFSVYISYNMSYRLIRRNRIAHNLNGFGILLFLFVAILFFVFTYFPPKIGLFLDPVTNGYSF